MLYLQFVNLRAQAQRHSKEEHQRLAVGLGVKGSRWGSALPCREGHKALITLHNKQAGAHGKSKTLC